MTQSFNLIIPSFFPVILSSLSTAGINHVSCTIGVIREQPKAGLHFG